MAGLRYVEADDPGLSRRRRGRGFSYRDAHGRPVDVGTVRRIVELAIPPAWREVWICPDELGHILATGQDDRGRKQYLYHPKWRELRDLLNFYRLIVFANHLPEVRAHVQRQLRRRSLDRSRVLAAMVRIIDASAIRIGSEEYADDNDSFGLTTLTRQHARVNGRRIELRFPAKSGSRAELTLSDPGIARLIAELKQQRARRLFTVGGEPIDAVEVNALLSELTDGHVTAKDFRTWKGTLAAFSYLREQVGDGGDPTRVALEAVDEAAGTLGNTRAVARAHYVHPQLLETFANDTFEDYLATSRPRPAEYLKEDERALLAFLQILLEKEFDRYAAAPKLSV